MTIEQLLTIVIRRIDIELTYEETDIYEIFEPSNPSWRYGLVKDLLHTTSLTSFEGESKVNDLCSFFMKT